MRKPFDSRVEMTRDDTVPTLEFKYTGSRMSQGEMVGTVLAVSMVITAPLALWPLIRSRTKKTHIRLDKEGVTVDGQHYPRERVQRLRTQSWVQGTNTAAGAEIKSIVFDYGTKRKTLASRLTEPELLWIHAEIQDFIGRHWVDLGEPTRM